jgi:hypothetical protein
MQRSGTRGLASAMLDGSNGTKDIPQYKITALAREAHVQSPSSHEIPGSRQSDRTHNRTSYYRTRSRSSTHPSMWPLKRSKRGSKSKGAPLSQDGGDLTKVMGELSVDEAAQSDPTSSSSSVMSTSLKYKGRENPVWTLQQSVDAFENKDTIYLSIDIETYEREPGLLTELGIIISHPPIATEGKFPITYPIHYIVKETSKYRNGRHVADNKYSFSYGTSRVVEGEVCKQAFEEILSHYQRLARENNLKIVMVGHGFASDLRVLTKLGFNVPTDFHIIDTELLWKSQRLARFSSLGKILKYLEIPHGLLHNAGNDAYLTLDLCFKLSDVQFRKQWKLDNNDLSNVSVEVKRDAKSYEVCNDLDEALRGILDSK